MAGKKENPLLVETNRRHKEFWDDINRRVADRMQKQPGDVQQANDQIREAILKDLINNLRNPTHVPTFEQKMLEYERVEKAAQVQKASAKRPNRADPFGDFTKRFLKRNPNATSKEVWAALVNDTELFQLSADETAVELVEEPKRKLSFSSIDSKVSRVRAQLKAKS